MTAPACKPSVERRLLQYLSTSPSPKVFPQPRAQDLGPKAAQPFRGKAENAADTQPGLCGKATGGASVTSLHPGAGIWGQVWAPAKAFIMLGECSFQIVSFCFPTPPNLCKNKLREFNACFQGPSMSNFLASVRAGTNPSWWLADAWPKPGGAGCTLRTCPAHCRCDGHPSKGHHSILPTTHTATIIPISQRGT